MTTTAPPTTAGATTTTTSAEDGYEAAMRPLYGNQNTRFDLIDDCFRLRLVADFLPQFPADAADELAHTNFAVMPNEVERAVRADVEQVPAVLAACTAITG